MSDVQNTPPPAPPSPQPKKDNKLQIIAASIFALAAAILIFAITLPSDGEMTSAPDTSRAPIVTSAPINKYDSYYEHVLNNSGQANTASKADVIEFGDLVCQSLDNGQSVAAVANVVSNASSSSSDIELGAAVIFGAIKYLCPEYDAMLQAYLNN